jgi:hypothetical protein
MNKHYKFFKNLYFNLINLIKNNILIVNLLVFLFFFIYILIIYINLPVLSSGDDHYFHFRFAERIFNNPNGFFDSFRDFKTIYFTNIANGVHLLYYNFLFYIILIPFTFITPLYLGIKLFAIVSIAFIGTILFYIFRKLNIKYSFLWAVGFFLVIGFGTFWRLFLSRPFVLSPIIILLLILAIYKKKYFWIFFLSFIPLFWHTATFFVPILVFIIYFLVYAFYYKKYLWKELFLVLSGTLSAILLILSIDSGFFDSIRDNLFSVISGVINFSGEKVNIIEVGGEVYPKNFFDFFSQNLILSLIFLSSMVFYALRFIFEIKNIKKFDNLLKSKRVIATVFFVLSSVFIVLIVIISNRFTDFFIFFGWIFVAIVYSDLFLNIKFNDLNIKKFLVVSFLTCLIYLFINNASQLNYNFASYGSRPETFQEVGNYLSSNLEKGDIVYNVTWNWFPQLYYYAPEQNYVIGLEPKLTYLYIPRIYWLWNNISKGYVCEVEKCPEIEQEINKQLRNRDALFEWLQKEGESIADVIINDFKSHYIISSTDYSQLNNVLNSSKRFERVLNSQDQYYIYKILPSENAK